MSKDNVIELRNLIDQRAVGLYAVLARDFEDFIDMCSESTTEVLIMLHKMLTVTNIKHNRDTRELNAIGAELVQGILDSRK